MKLGSAVRLFKIEDRGTALRLHVRRNYQRSDLKARERDERERERERRERRDAGYCATCVTFDLWVPLSTGQTLIGAPQLVEATSGEDGVLVN